MADYNSNGIPLQDLAYKPCNQLVDQDEIGSTSNSLEPDDCRTEPIARQIWKITLDVLNCQQQVTIKNILEHPQNLAGDSTVRGCFNRWVEKGYLVCTPGQGRRPAYYFLPLAKSAENPELQESSTVKASELQLTTTSAIPSQNTDYAGIDINDDDALDTLKHLIEELKTKVARIEEELQQTRDILETRLEEQQTLEKAIEIKRKLNTKITLNKQE